MKNIICITGYPASGKGTAKQYFEKQGYTTTTMGDEVRRRVQEERPEQYNNPPNGKVKSDIAREFAVEKREETHNAIVAEWLTDYISNHEDDIIIVEGVRSPESIEYFETIGTVTIISITAPDTLRTQRIAERGRDGEEENPEVVRQKRDRDEEKTGLNDVVDMADKSISNNSSIDDFYDRLDAFLEEENLNPNSH